MRPVHPGLKFSLLLLAVALAACQQRNQTTDSEGTPRTGGSAAGAYSCAPDPPPDDPNWPGPEDFELKEDGKLTIGRAGKINQEGTWTVEESQVVFRLEGQDDRFNIEGDRLVAAGGPPPPGGGKFICTKKAS